MLKVIDNFLPKNLQEELKTNQMVSMTLKQLIAENNKEMFL